MAILMMRAPRRFFSIRGGRIVRRISPHLFSDKFLWVQPSIICIETCYLSKIQSKKQYIIYDHSCDNNKVRVTHLMTSGEWPVGMAPPVSLNMRPKYSRSWRSRWSNAAYKSTVKEYYRWIVQIANSSISPIRIIKKTSLTSISADPFAFLSRSNTW